MNDHVIRVIIQGYDRVSNVMRDAAGRASPALDKLRDSTTKLRKETDRDNQSFISFESHVDSLTKKIDAQSDRVDKLSNAWGRLRSEVDKTRQRISGAKQDIDPGAEWDRLVAANQRPRTDSGRAISRNQFITRALRDEQNALKENTRAVNENAEANKKLFDGLGPLDDFARGWKRFEQQSLSAQDTLRQQQLAHQKALADFDEDANRRRRLIEQQNEASRSQVQRQASGSEEELRKGLLAIEKQLDDFVNRENLRLAKKKIKIRSELGPETEDQRIAASRSKKISDEERDAAKDRIAAAKSVVATRIAEESSESERRVLIRQREFEQIRRITLEGIKEGERESLGAQTVASRVRVQQFDAEEKQKRIILRKNQQSEINDLPSLVRKRVAAEAEEVRRFSSRGDTTKFEAFGARASRGTSDFIRGFRGVRQGLQEFMGDARKAQSTLSQLGGQFGEATKGINNLVNVRWGLLISLIGVLGTVVTQLGAALVAVASSAIMAGAALGGALIAGVAQALPVVGLLALAFKSLEDAMKVVDLRQQANDKTGQDAKAQADARRRSNEQLADSNYALGQSINGVVQAEQGLRNAHEGVADARYGLRQSTVAVTQAEQNLRDAHQRVTDAEKNQREAVENLANARRDARRAIVDAAIEEKDARLGVREAELGVLDAKQRLADFEDRRKRGATDLVDAQAAAREAQDRLRLAKQQGDAIEIATAAAAVSVATGNVTSIKDQINETANQQKELELGIQRAEISERQAKIRRDRAVADNRRTRNDGVEGAPGVRSARDQVTSANRAFRDSTRDVASAVRDLADSRHNVVLALRGIRDAIENVTNAQNNLKDSHHNVVQAHRNVRDAQLGVADAADKMSQAQRNAKREFGQLSPAQQQFVLSMERLRRDMKKYLDPITDIIVRTFSRGLDTIDKLLRDPKIRASLTNLANRISDVGDKFIKWSMSPEARRTLLTFIDNAAKNLPIVADAAGKFAGALVDIANAASPVFTRLLGDIDDLAEKFKDFTTKSREPSPFERLHFDPGEAPTSRLERFFGIADKHLKAWEGLAKAVGNLIGALIGASASSGLEMVQAMTESFNDLADNIRDNPKAFEDFFKRVQDGLGKLLPVLGEFALTLLAIFTSPEMIEFTSFMLLTVIPAVLRVVAVIGKLIGVIGGIVDAIDGILGVPVVSTLGKWIIGWGLFFGILVKIFPFLKIFGPLLGAIGDALLILGGILVDVLIANPWVAVILGAIAAIVILDRHFHFIRPTIEALGRGFKRLGDSIVEFFTHPIRWLKEHWKGLLINAVLTPFGLIPRLIFIALEIFFPKFAASIENGFLAPFKALGRWFRNIGSWLQNNLINPILNFFGIHSPSTLMFRIGMDVVNGFVNAIKKLPGMVLGIMKTLPGMIVDLFKGFGKKLMGEIYDKLPSPVKKLVGGITGIAGKALDKGKSLVQEGLSKFAHGGHVTGSEGQEVPIIAHAGEWVLNKKQQSKLAKSMGTSRNNVSGFLFGQSNDSSQFADGGIVGALKRVGKKAVKAIGNVVTLGAAQDPSGAKEYWINFVKSLDPRTREGFVNALSFIVPAGRMGAGARTGLYSAAETRAMQASAIRRGLDEPTQWGETVAARAKKASAIRRGLSEHTNWGKSVEKFADGGIVGAIKRGVKSFIGTKDPHSPFTLYKNVAKGIRNSFTDEEWNELLEYPGAGAAGHTIPLFAGAIGAGRVGAAKVVKKATGKSVADEASAYLRTVEEFRKEGHDPHWAARTKAEISRLTTKKYSGAELEDASSFSMFQLLDFNDLADGVDAMSRHMPKARGKRVTDANNRIRAAVSSNNFNRAIDLIDGQIGSRFITGDIETNLHYMRDTVQSMAFHNRRFGVLPNDFGKIAAEQKEWKAARNAVGDTPVKTFHENLSKLLASKSKLREKIGDTDKGKSLLGNLDEAELQDNWIKVRSLLNEALEQGHFGGSTNGILSRMLNSVENMYPPHFADGGIVGKVKNLAKRAIGTKDPHSPFTFYKKLVSGVRHSFTDEEWQELMDYPGAGAAGHTLPLLAGVVGAGRVGSARVSEKIASKLGQKVFYHGTKDAFGSFKLRKAQQEGLYGPGFYFTSSPNVASSYATGEFITKNTRSYYGPRGVFHDEQEIREYLEDHQNHLLLRKENVMYNYDQLGRHVPASFKGSRREPRIAADFLDTTWEKPNVRMARLGVKNPFNVEERIRVGELNRIEKVINKNRRRLDDHFTTHMPDEVRRGRVSADVFKRDNIDQELATIRNFARMPAGRYKRFGTNVLGESQGSKDYLYQILRKQYGPRETQKILQQAGFDSIKYAGGKRLGGEEHDVYVVFNNNQVRTPFGKAKEKIQKFAQGGHVGGMLGKAVPIIAHAGEWVVNKSQQSKLAAATGMSESRLSNSLFGTDNSSDTHFADGGIVGKLKNAAKSVGKFLKPDFKHDPFFLLERLGYKKFRSMFNDEEWSELLEYPGMGAAGHTLPLLAGALGAGRIGERIILPGSIKIIPAKTPANFGPDNRIPALFLKDKRSLVVGHSGHGHSNLYGYLDNNFPGKTYNSENAVEIGLHLGDKEFGTQTQWRIYAKHANDGQEKGLVELLQRYRNEPVFLSDYESGKVSELIAPARNLKRDTFTPASKLAHDTDLSVRSRTFLAGKDWKDPPKPRWTGTAVNKEVSTTRGDIGEALVARMVGGRIKSAVGKGGQGKFDVTAGKFGKDHVGFEVKTMSADSQKYQASPRPGEIESKHDYATEHGITPRLAYVIVDKQTGKASVYSREGLIYGRLNKDGFKRGWTFHGSAKLNDDQLQHFNQGGDVGGTPGEPIPIIAHAGEWVLNKAQQAKLAKRFGTHAVELQNFLFGSKGKAPTPANKPTAPPTSFPNGVELTPTTDDNGIDIYFLKLKNGNYAQVSKSAAKRITDSNGNWIPGYAMRAGGAFTLPVGLNRLTRGFANGGVVSFGAPSARSFAAGGVVDGKTVTTPGSGGNTVHQEFNVRTEGESDWNHIMRLGAQHAQGSY
jgi:hypothetical protein